MLAKTAQSLENERRSFRDYNSFLIDLIEEIDSLVVYVCVYENIG